jgi:hypothetical protein
VEAAAAACLGDGISGGFLYCSRRCSRWLEMLNASPAAISEIVEVDGHLVSSPAGALAANQVES